MGFGVRDAWIDTSFASWRLCEKQNPDTRDTFFINLFQSRIDHPEIDYLYDLAVHRSRSITKAVLF